MSSANNIQVGGAHYRTTIQHWDFVAQRLGWRYFVGQATKYLTRWRKKGGRQDVEKARHFVAKLLELAPVFHEQIKWELYLDELYTSALANSTSPGKLPRPPAGLPFIEVGDYLRANEVTGAHERFAIAVLMEWRGSGGQLEAVLCAIDTILADNPAPTGDARQST